MDWKLALKLALPMVVDLVKKKAAENPAIDAWDYGEKVMSALVDVLHMTGFAAGEPNEYELAALEVKNKLEAAAAEGGS